MDAEAPLRDERNLHRKGSNSSEICLTRLFTLAIYSSLQGDESLTMVVGLCGPNDLSHRINFTIQNVFRIMKNSSCCSFATLTICPFNADNKLRWKI